MEVFPISSNLRVTVEKGDYGHFVRLIRGTRWISLSAPQWYRLTNNLVPLNSDKYSLKLTNEKEVNVAQFADRRYVSFHTIRRVKDDVFDNYINLNNDEWKTFQQLTPKVSALLHIPPPKCHEEKNVTLVDGRMKKTQLDDAALADVYENNMYAYNQLGYSCEYCGGNEFYGERCHCHKYDCRECEPDNFCNGCQKLTISA